MDWLKDADKRGLAHLPTPREEFRTMFLLNKCSGGSSDPPKLPLMLPASLMRRELMTYLSTGHPNMVSKIRSCKDSEMEEFVKVLLCSLNSEFALHLQA